MARSKNCLHCKYCRLFDRSGGLSDWRNGWSCDYYVLKNRSDDKGSDPDKCLLFEPREKRSITAEIALKELAKKEELGL